MKKILFYQMILIYVVSLTACGETVKNRSDPEPEKSETLYSEDFHPEAFHSEAFHSETFCSEDFHSEAFESENAEPYEVPSEQMQWHVYISPDTPQPYIEVLEQYEQFMNADNQDLNDDRVQAKLRGGEWNCLYDELCGACLSSLDRKSSSPIQYAFQDLTGDGCPEMIMAYGDIPYIIYHYSETNGIGMEYASSYYTMTIYENYIVEYCSGGMYSSTTYLQFQQDADAWVAADIIAVDSTWDSVNNRTNDIAYYGGSWGGDGRLTDTISKEEYQNIQKKYVTEPMEFDWLPLIYNKINVWHYYETKDDFPYDHNFMKSRDGQGYHWWLYWEAANIMLDYGKKIGYDFTSDYWTVERIYPISGGYYNMMLSQDDHDVSMDLLFHPEEGKYVVLYAQYENGKRKAGVNDIPYDSQLSWYHFDFNENYHVIAENPFEIICENSVSCVLYISLYRYGQEMGYEGTWYVRELFGRSPFFDYYVESDNGLFWFCVDIGQHCYSYVAFES